MARYQTVRRETVLLGEIPVPVEWKTGVRNYRIRVREDKTVLATAPARASRAAVERFLRSREGWIREKQNGGSAPLSPSPFESGELTLEGKRLPFAARPGKKTLLTVTEEGASLLFRGDGEAALARALSERLARRAKPLFSFWEEATGLRASGFSVRRMSSRWGSCTVGSGRIRLSLSLSREPDRLLSYVILHELAHLRYPDHGAGFRAFLGRFLPDWEARRRELCRRTD